MSKFSSSFNGKISEIPCLRVDNFENPTKDGARAYFLSHYHTDHIVGLHRYELLAKLRAIPNVFIYTTKMTSAIIKHNDKPLGEYVIGLELGSNLISIPGDEIDSELILNVTLIPAGHCLGSTMFLFETVSLKILYTGDFRIQPNDLTKYAAFHDKNGYIKKLDALYVDTTFLNSNESFPKRSDSTEECMELLKGYLNSHEDQCIILDTSAYYGYEYIFNRIYDVLGMKVYVDDRRWEFYSNIQNFVRGVTNNADETRIFLKAVPLTRTSSVLHKTIRFSAMRWKNWNEGMNSVQEDNQTAYVAFSTHCSRMELISFVDYLNPVKVVGFPYTYSVKDSPSKLTDGKSFILSPKKSPKKLPSPFKKSGHKDKKVDGAVLKKIFG